MKNKNYYEILHVQPDAPVEVIRSSYRTLMQQLKMHPDLGGGDDSAALVNQAYNILKNPSLRAEYDLALNNKSKQTQQHTHNFYSANIADLHSICPFCETPHNLGKEVELESTCTQCSSVLYPATKHTLVKSGKRMIDRIDRNWPITYSVGWPNAKTYQGISKDVSLNGMQIITDTRIEIDHVLKISSNTMQALAKVVNLRENPQDKQFPWRIGLEFLTLRFHQAQGTFVKVSV